LERFDLENRSKAKKADEKKEKIDEVALAVAEKAEEIKFFQAKITEILEAASKMLEQNADILDADKKREIQKRLDLLSRLRQSNAIDHLKSLTKKLLEQISDDAIFLETVNPTPEQLAEIEARKGEFKKFSESVGHKIEKGLTQIQLNFTPPTAEELKQKFIELNPEGRAASTLYWGVVAFFGMLTTFWVVNAVQMLRGIDVTKNLFYFASPILWFATGLAAILSLAFAPQVFARGRFSWRQRLTTLSVAAVLVLVFVLEFPAIFYWTR